MTRLFMSKVTSILVSLPIFSATPGIAENGKAVGGMFIETAEVSKAKTTSDANLNWWRDGKFGLFIHWGVYAVPGDSEWGMNQKKTPVAKYKEFAKDFNPVKYDPEEWVRLAKEAGMKYIIITAKHHDGFALFETKASDWNIVQATPYGKDLLKPLAEACRKQGIRLGFYYSQAQDWVNRGSAIGGKWDSAQDGEMGQYTDKVAIPQVRELLTQYGADTPAILWWDTPHEFSKEQVTRLLTAVKEIRPGVIQNDRAGGGNYGNYRTPEQFVPIAGVPGDWETCMTMNESWSYAKWDKGWKSSADLIRKLADIASKGGNFLLNVGPNPEGEFPEQAVDRLKAIGRWMKNNSESIYGTKAGPFQRLSWGAATRKGNLLYLHVFDWPKDGSLRVPLLSDASDAWLLVAPDQKLDIVREAERLVIKVPAEAPDPVDSVIVLKLDGEPKVKQLPTLNATATATASQPDRGPDNILDGSDGKRWLGPQEAKSASVEIDLGSELAVAGYGFDEPDVWPRMKQTFTLEALVDGSWQKIGEGETRGHGKVASFPAITARKFRLNVNCEKGGPAVAEFQLYRPE